MFLIYVSVSMKHRIEYKLNFHSVTLNENLKKRELCFLGISSEVLNTCMSLFIDLQVFFNSISGSICLTILALAFINLKIALEWMQFINDCFGTTLIMKDCPRIDAHYCYYMFPIQNWMLASLIYLFLFYKDTKNFEYVKEFGKLFITIRYNYYYLFNETQWNRCVLLVLTKA